MTPIFAMDYLTILATQSLVLFPRLPQPPPLPLTTSQHRRPSAGLSPPPLTMPLLSLMNHDTHCAYYLMGRVLETAGVQPDSLDSHHMPSQRWCKEYKAVLQEAEVLVWEQIDRAKMFARALGQSFTLVDRIDEEHLKELAAAHGLGIDVAIMTSTEQQRQSPANGPLPP